MGRLWRIKWVFWVIRKGNRQKGEEWRRKIYRELCICEMKRLECIGLFEILKMKNSEWFWNDGWCLPTCVSPIGQCTKIGMILKKGSKVKIACICRWIWTKNITYLQALYVLKIELNSVLQITAASFVLNFKHVLAHHWVFFAGEIKIAQPLSAIQNSIQF